MKDLDSNHTCEESTSNFEVDGTNTSAHWAPALAWKIWTGLVSGELCMKGFQQAQHTDIPYYYHPAINFELRNGS